MTIRTLWRVITQVDSWLVWDDGEVLWDQNGNVSGVLWDATSDTTPWVEQT